jgi:Ubiquitin-2 like Rad60 SUMO-like
MTSQVEASAEDVKIDIGPRQPPHPQQQPVSWEGKLTIAMRLLNGEKEFVHHYALKRATKLKRLAEAWCRTVQGDSVQFRYVFEGTSVDLERTPEQLGMENGDVIEVFTKQYGGA